jgi:hypothetical protein
MRTLQPIHQLPKTMPNNKILLNLHKKTTNWRIILTNALLGKPQQLPTKTWTASNSLAKPSRIPKINLKLEAEYRAQKKLAKQNSKPIVPF